MPSHLSVMTHAPAPAASNKRWRRRKTAQRGSARGAINAQHGAWRAIECVMFVYVNVTGIIHIWRNGFVMPAVASQNKSQVRHLCRRLKKESIHARFQIGRSVSQKTKIARETFFRWNRKMRVRIERGINRNTFRRSGGEIRIRHRRTATARKYEIVFRNQRPERILRIIVDPVERRRRVHVEKGHQRAGLF